MKSESESEVLFFAPIHCDTQFVEFRLEARRHETTTSSWNLKRRIIDDVGAQNHTLMSQMCLSSPKHTRSLPPYMDNITVIDSRPPETTRATNDASDPYFDLLRPLFDEFGVDHVYVTTENSESIEKLAGCFSDTGTVIIFGGDTSVHEFVNGLNRLIGVEHELRIIVIPTGTGNALSISSGLLTPIDAIRRFFLSTSGDFVPLSTLPVRFQSKTDQTGVNHDGDTMLFSKEHRALVVVSWGLHSALVADSDTPEMRAAFKEHPNDRFKEAARINLAEVLQRYHGEVTLLTDHGIEHVFGPEHSYLLFTIVTHLEKGFLISPHSHPPSDNCVHIVALKPFESLSEQRTQIMRIMGEVYDHGSHIRDPLVNYRALRGTIRVKVGANQSKEMRRWCLDGKIITADAGIVEIGTPSSCFNGWTLSILRG